MLAAAGFCPVLQPFITPLPGCCLTSRRRLSAVHREGQIPLGRQLLQVLRVRSGVLAPVVVPMPKLELPVVLLTQIQQQLRQSQ